MTPPLDRELFFEEPELSGAKLSPDGYLMAFIKPYKGIRNIWVKETHAPMDSGRPLTAESTRPILSYQWTRDSNRILFLKDDRGDENDNVFVVDAEAKADSATGVPVARNLTKTKGVSAWICHVPKSDPDHIVVALNERDPAWHDLYRIDLNTGMRTLLRENRDRITEWTFDHADHLRLATRIGEDGERQILRLDPSGVSILATASIFEELTPVRFHEDGRQVYIETNVGARDLTHLALLHVETGQQTIVHADPEERVDLIGTLFSEKSNTLLAVFYEDDRPRTCLLDAGFAGLWAGLEAAFAGKRITPTSWTDDDLLLLISVAGDNDPGETFLLDRATGSITPQFKFIERLPREHLAERTPISYPSSDGLIIPAYLSLPPGAEPEALPLVVLPHGGPWARDRWGYAASSQFLVNRGYAVLEPNFRGSTGYGKRFLNAGNREWGAKMQDDLTWGVKHLVSRGIVDPTRVAIMGGSYGGYAALAGAAFTPGLYSAIIAIVAPSHLVTFLKSLPSYWDWAQHMLSKRVGDPSTPEGRELLEQRSPLNAADAIRVPLLIFHGANDPRVKQAESDRIVESLRQRNLPVDYLLADNEGHSLNHPLNRLAVYAAIERFLARHLGGRFQDSMSKEVARRLEEITVPQQPGTPALSL